ncbi:MAG: S8 family serine peptidase [bacterium]
MHSPFLLKISPDKYIFLSLLLLGLIFPYPVRAAIYPYPVSGALYPPGAFFSVPSAYVPRYRTGEVLVRFKAGVSPALMGSLSRKYALRQVSSSPYSGFHRVATAAVAGDLVQALRREPGVALAEANFIRHVEEFVPNDPVYNLQWHLHVNGLPLAWELSAGQNVVVAVLDTGIAYENYLKFAQAPDLANTSFLPGWDFVNNDANPDDDNRHGTHIAGIIAQSTNNLTGGAGVAFQCSLIPVKVLDASGAGDVATIVDGVYYAVNNGAQIINMSYGSIADPSAAEEEAINYAVSQGVLVVCSAGNEASSQPHYPSSYPDSLSITATRFDNSFASSYSNYGPDVDLAAPGGDLSLDQDGDGNPDGIYQQTHDGRNFRRFDFYYAEGTSSACAYASGVAALVLARGGGLLSAAQVREILESTAIDLDTPGWDQYYGWGVLNPHAALLAVDAAIIAPVAAAQGRLWPFLVTTPVDNLIRAYNPLSSLIGSSTVRESRASAGYLPADRSISPGGYFPLTQAAGFPASWPGIPTSFAGGSRVTDTISGLGYSPLIASYYGLLWPVAVNISPGKVLFAP